MNPPDASIIVATLAVLSSLVFWWRQLLRILAGIFIFLTVVGLLTVLSVVQYFP